MFRPYRHVLSLYEHGQLHGLVPVESFGCSPVRPVRPVVSPLEFHDPFVDLEPFLLFIASK